MSRKSNQAASSTRIRSCELFDFGVTVDSEVKLSSALQNHVVEVIEVKSQKHNRDEVKQLKDTSKSMRAWTEATLRYHIVKCLMFECQVREGEKGIDLSFEGQWDPQYTTRTLGSRTVMIQQAQPDAINGYLSRLNAGFCNLEYVFTKDEEDMLTENNIEGMPPHLEHVGALIPFLTCQLGRSGEGMIKAQLRAARDGAAVGQYLRELYDFASKPVTEVDTCHWSLTYDTSGVVLWLHWREDRKGDDFQLHMSKECSVSFHVPRRGAEKNGLEHLCDYLANIKDYAMGPRLEKLKPALKRIADREAKSAAGEENTNSTEPQNAPTASASTTSTRRRATSGLRKALVIKKRRTGD